MEQILAIQPAPSQPSSTSPGAQDDQSQFSPHLQAALNSKNNAKALPPESSQSTSIPESSHLTSIQEELKNAESTESLDDLLTPVFEIAQTEAFSEEIGQAQVTDSASMAALHPLGTVATAAMQITIAAEMISVPDQASPAVDLSQAVTNPAEKNTVVQNLSVTAVDDTAPLFSRQYSPLNSYTAASETADQNNLLNSKVTTRYSSGNSLVIQQDKILSQLQQIIDNSSETSRVTITQTSSFTGTYSNVSSSARADLQPQYQSHVFADLASQNSSTTLTVSSYVTQEELILNASAADDNPQDLAGVRINTKQQFYDAKLGEPVNTGNDKSNHSNTNNNPSEDGDTLEQFGQQLSSSQQVTSSSTSGEQTNTFSQAVSTAQSLETSTPAQLAKPVIPVPTNLVHEQEILQQLMDKFQVNFRKPETSLNIRLHPAELGELKIDLTVKEGSIRANVLAQSQHVQEILEKNLPRLKTILEEQGFTVDAITVAAESDSVAEFDLFDSHLFSRQNNTAAPQKTGQRSAAGIQPENLEQETIKEISGVNVTA